MKDVEFQVLPQRQISEDVYKALHEKIVGCQLLPGERLAVEQIAVQLGVSRTPVKDALGRLAAEGLVDLQPRRGTFVAQMNPQNVRDNFEVREALEIKACELLTGKMDPQKITQLRHLNERLTRTGIDLAENALLDGQFHRLLVEYSGNRRLLEVYVTLNAHLQIARIHYRSDNWRSRLAVARLEHEAILDALENDRIGEAMSLVKLHIRSSMQRMISDVAAITNNDGMQPSQVAASQ